MKKLIIIAATDFAQKYGLNAFSYQDLSEIIGIRKASIHHHFPTKVDLAKTILIEYSNNFFNGLNELKNQHLSGLELFRSYTRTFNKLALEHDKICLGLMYASDYITLNKDIQNLVKQFYTNNELWLSNVLVNRVNIAPTLKLIDAKIIFATLQGLIIRNRIKPDLEEFTELVKRLEKTFFEI